MDTSALKLEVKTKLIEFLNLSPLKPEEIVDEAPLFREGLALDSIDSLELIVMLKREYGITIQDPKDGRKIMTSINTMVEYIQKNRTI